MKPTSEHIKQMLLADTNVDTIKYPPFIANEPGKPANCFTIFDTDSNPVNTLQKLESTESSSIQIRVRATKYLDGWNLIESIKKSLHGRASESWGDYLYTLVLCSSGPEFLDWDDSQRVRLIINFDIQRVNCTI